MNHHKVETDKERIDAYLSRHLDLSRSHINACIKDKKVLVNGKSVKPSYVLNVGDTISYEDCIDLQVQDIEPENIPLDILYEDEHILAINKPAGLLTHPSLHQSSGTLVNALMHHSSHLSDINGKDRVGIVHRLDKETTGVMVVAKTNQAHRYLGDLFQKRLVQKIYIAVVDGHFPDQFARIEIPVDHFYEKSCMKVSSQGKMAVTEVKLLEHFSKFSLLSVQIHTGRTHQIRVHLSHLGYPVHGDPVYNKKMNQSDTMLLHSWKLSFVPMGEHSAKEFIAPIPKTFSSFLSLNGSLVELN